MNSHVIVDGMQHPSAAEILKHIDLNAPLNGHTRTMRRRTLQVLNAHLRHGSQWRSHLPPLALEWVKNSSRTVTYTRTKPHIRTYWTIMDRILAQPPERLLLPPEIGIHKPEATAMTTEVQDKASPQWTRDQRYDLRALDTPDILPGNDAQRATTIWWHYLFILRDKYDNGWRFSKDREARALKDVNLRVFVNMQRELLVSGVLTPLQADMVKLLLDL